VPKHPASFLRYGQKVFKLESGSISTENSHALHGASWSHFYVQADLQGKGKRFSFGRIPRVLPVRVQSWFGVIANVKINDSLVEQSEYAIRERLVILKKIFSAIKLKEFVHPRIGVPTKGIANFTQRGPNTLVLDRIQHRDSGLSVSKEVNSVGIGATNVVILA
jgi:hypothetical protein